MKKTVKTSELIGAALDWAVAKREGMTHKKPQPMTDAAAEKMPIPFYLWGTVSHKDKNGNWSTTVEKIKVVRYGVDKSAGATSPSISFIGDDNIECRGFVGMFVGSEEEAKASILYENSPYQWEEGGFQPSLDWSQGGPIIEREAITVSQGAPVLGLEWMACDAGSTHVQHGPTYLIAAMRCYVASNLGDEVNVPKELL